MASTLRLKSQKSREETEIINIFKNTFFSVTKENEIYHIEYHKSVDLIIPKMLYDLDLISRKISKQDDNMELLLNEEIITIIPLEEQLRVKGGQLSYIEVQNFIIQIGKQIEEIERKGFSVPFINLNDIIVLNDNIFIYLGVEILEIINYEEEKKIEMNITKPYRMNYLFSPELQQMSRLPYKITNKSWHYSLGMIGIFLLSKNKRLERKNHKELMYEIIDIEDTKLYFCIKRCIEPNPENRYYYYI